MAIERQTVVGVFHERDNAERAVEALRRDGFRDEQIGFVMQGEDHVRQADTDAGGPGAGGVVGGILAGAGIGGVVAAAGALLIPGFGPVVAGGILATVLGGAAIGAAAGGIIGALVDMGVPEDEARYYEGELREGRILVTVKADGRYAEARDILRNHDAYDIETRGTAIDTGVHRAATLTDWDQASPRYREQWQVRWGTSGARWEDYEPGYRYSYEMSHDPRFQHRSWDEVEPEMRRDYGTWSQRYGYRHMDSDWDRMREHMRESWENEQQTRHAA